MNSEARTNEKKVTKILSCISYNIYGFFRAVKLFREAFDEKDAEKKALEAERNHAVNQFEEVCSAYITKVSSLEAENAKLKKALEKIANTRAGSCTADIMADIAKDAIWNTANDGEK